MPFCLESQHDVLQSEAEVSGQLTSGWTASTSPGELVQADLLLRLQVALQVHQDAQLDGPT